MLLRLLDVKQLFAELAIVCASEAVLSFLNQPGQVLQQIVMGSREEAGQEGANHFSYYSQRARSPAL